MRFFVKPAHHGFPGFPIPLFTNATKSALTVIQDLQLHHAAPPPKTQAMDISTLSDSRPRLFTPPPGFELSAGTIHDPCVGLACADSAAAGSAADEASVIRHVKDVHNVIEDRKRFTFGHPCPKEQISVTCQRAADIQAAGISVGTQNFSGSSIELENDCLVKSQQTVEKAAKLPIS